MSGSRGAVARCSGAAVLPIVRVAWWFPIRFASNGPLVCPRYILEHTQLLSEHATGYYLLHCINLQVSRPLDRPATRRVTSAGHRERGGHAFCFAGPSPPFSPLPFSLASKSSSPGHRAPMRDTRRDMRELIANRAGCLPPFHLLVVLICKLC